MKKVISQQMKIKKKVKLEVVMWGCLLENSDFLKEKWSKKNEDKEEMSYAIRATNQDITSQITPYSKGTPKELKRVV